METDIFTQSPHHKRVSYTTGYADKFLSTLLSSNISMKKITFVSKQSYDFNNMKLRSCTLG